jgi:hypothetical protein
LFFQIGFHPSEHIAEDRPRTVPNMAKEEQ